MHKEIIVAGSLNLDLVVRVPRLPGPGETISGSDLLRLTGGKGANQAVAAARLGARVLMIGRHGADGEEAALLRDLRTSGVDIAGLTPTEGATGTAVVLVAPGGQNSIIVSAGANGKVTAADLESHRDRIAEAGMMLLQLEVPIAAVSGAVRLARGCGVPVMLDPAPALPLPPEVLAGSTWLTPNETEAKFILGHAPPEDVVGLQAYAEQMLRLGPRNLVLKLGARGAFAAIADGTRELVSAPEVAAVDTTGAGDALNGALAAALARGADPIEAVRFAVAAASVSTTRAGALPGMPTEAEVRALSGLHSASTKGALV